MARKNIGQKIYAGSPRMAPKLPKESKKYTYSQLKRSRGGRVIRVVQYRFLKMKGK